MDTRLPYARTYVTQRTLAVCGAVACFAWLLLASSATAEGPGPQPDPRTNSKPACADGMILSSGRPDPGIFAPSASLALRGHWCESYDARGVTTRSGPYWESGADGVIRTEAHYVASRLEGPVIAYHDNGAVFLRGFLVAGEWQGRFELFDDRGNSWFEASFEAGRLDGLVRTLYADGALQSEARFQNGREDGLARSFYATAAGGRLKSEARIEADSFIGVHRVFARDGALAHSIDWNTSRLSWRDDERKRSKSPYSRPPPASRPASQESAARN